jgi:hypothetical protein
MWMVSAVHRVDVPLWNHRGQPRSVYVSSTAFRSIEVAIVTNELYPRDRGYLYLRRGPAYFGIFFGAVANPNAARSFVMLFPYWLLFVLAASWPAVSLWRRGRAQRLAAWRRRNRLCVACGYDVRASTDACPECGARLPGAATAAGL